MIPTAERVMERTALATWRLGWKLRPRRSTSPRTWGAEAWSRAEVARLHPGWVRRFQRCERAKTWWRKQVLMLLILLALGLLSFAAERFWHWQYAAQAVAGEAETVTKWEAWCRLYPQAKACQRPKGVR